MLRQADATVRVQGKTNALSQIKPKGGKENTMTSDEITEYYFCLTDFAKAKYRDCSYIDDVIQESFLSFLLDLHSGKEITNPKAYLRAVLLHKYNDALRRKYRQRVDYYGDMTVVCDEFRSSDDSADTVDEETAEQLRREIGRLSKIYREVMVRFYMRGEPVEKISTELGIPKGTVMSRLNRGRELVREGFRKMENYSELSYAPKKTTMSIVGYSGTNGEPFSLVNSRLEQNLLIAAYEKPLTVSSLSGIMGVPAAYLEDIAEKLTEGELMGKTAAGLYYTRCFTEEYNRSFGDEAAQRSAAEELCEPIWNEVWRVMSPITAEEEVKTMNEKQKSTLFLFLTLQSLTDAIIRIMEENGAKINFPNDIPERPNGGRWIAQLRYMDDGARLGKYETSGPVQNPFSRNNDGQLEYISFTYQSMLGETHFSYGKHPIWEVSKLLASYVTDVKPDNDEVYELIPNLIEMKILRREKDGSTALDIPALSFDTANKWQPAATELNNNIYEIVKDRLSEIYLSHKNSIPRHVDNRNYYEHDGALGCYRIIQLCEIVNRGLMPYKAEIGRTPIIYIRYKKS